MNSSTLRIVYALLMVFNLASCSLNPVKSSQADIGTVKIAVVFPTGDVGVAGQLDKSVELAIQMYQEKNELPYEIELDSFVDPCESTQAVELAKQIVDEGYDFIIGMICGLISPVASQVIADSGAVVIRPNMFPHPQSPVSNQFTLVRDVDFIILGVTQFIQYLSPPKVALVYDGSPEGEYFVHQSATLLKEMGIPVRDPIGVNTSSRNRYDLFRTLYTEEYDYVLFGGGEQTLNKVLHTAKNQNYKGLFITSDMSVGINTYGLQVEGLIVLKSDVLPMKISRDLYSRFLKAGIYAYMPMNLASYVSPLVLIEAIDRANSADPMLVGKEIEKGHFDTVIGRLTWSAAWNDNPIVEPVVYHRDGSHAPYSLTQ